MTEEIHEENVFNILSEFFELKHKYGQLLNLDRKFRPIERSANMTLKSNRESTNEIASPKKINPDANSKDLTRKQAQGIISINTKLTPIVKINYFDFTDSKVGKKFNYEYNHWGANKKVMEIINKREKSPETFDSILTAIKTGKYGSTDDRTKEGGRDEVAAIDLELLFRNNEKNRWAEVTLSSTNQKGVRARSRKRTRIRVKHREERCGEIFVKFFHS